MRPREERATEYAEALKERHKHMPDVKRISKFRQVPKLIKTLQEKARVSKESERRKEANRRRHSKPDAPHSKPERDQAVVAQLE